MRTFSLLLLVALTALVESKWSYYSKRGKRELLVRSKRRWVLSTVELTENDGGPFPKLISQMFNDQTHNEGQRYEISGMGVTESPMGVFKIDEDTGEVFALKPVDREEHDLYKIRFDIYSKKTGARLDKELSFNIEIKDENDNAPEFEPPVMVYKAKENKLEGEPLGQLLANDRDQRNHNNSIFTMSIVSQEPKEPKMSLELIDEKTSQLRFKGCFNYDKAKQYKVVVKVVDKGYPPLSSTGVITVNIADTNSHLPTFKENKYRSEVPEATVKNDILRIGVDDKDTPNTPGWRAKYFFIKGNEEKNYDIKTDPVTNEGILSVIKGKDFERTSFTHLLIGVENDEPLFACKDDFSGTLDPLHTPKPHAVNVTIKVIDVNDPPYYEKTKENVYQKEEEPPGKVLFTPKIKDDDSDVSNIRHVVLEDPAGWVTIDEKTGKITTVKKMDRESPHVKDGIYKVVVGAIDDGEPIATGSCTILVHLGDINDNKPKLVSNGVILCGDKTNKVMLSASDTDDHPFGAPFSFALGGDDKTLKQRWKLDPSYGEKSWLISLKHLAYDNYSVPLLIQDQQGSVAQETVEVMVCECGGGDSCLVKEPPSSSLGPGGIGLFFLGLLLFLLLLLLIMCECRQKEFQKMNVMQDEGNQTLIKYNQEGGGSECKAEPTLLLTPTNSVAMTDGIKMGTMQMSQAAPVMAQDIDIYNSSAFTTMNSNMTAMGTHRRSNTVRSGGVGQNMYSWSRSNTYGGGASRYNRHDRSVSMRSNLQIADHIDRRLYMIDGNHLEHPMYQPYEYAYEGQGSKCQSLDKLSLSNLGEDLMFVNDLGPKFNTLGGICHQAIQEKNIQL